jgi:REP element-mobilizing transposase RayT
MSSTHTALHFHVVFSTKNREPWFPEPFRTRLHSYLAGTLSQLGAHPRRVGGVADHVHLLYDLRTSQCVADTVQELKKASSAWIREELRRRVFHWQEGYGAFTVSAGNLDAATRYIQHQEQHHRKVTYKEEYISLLNKAGIEYREEYLW